MTTRYILQLYAETELIVNIDGQEYTLVPGDKVKMVWEREDTTIKVKRFKNDNN